jgi:hypothetical protein
MATSDDKMKWSDGSEERRQDLAMETICDGGNDGEGDEALFFSGAMAEDQDPFDWLLNVDCLDCLIFVLMVVERQPSSQKENIQVWWWTTLLPTADSIESIGSIHHTARDHCWITVVCTISLFVWLSTQDVC